MDPGHGEFIYGEAVVVAAEDGCLIVEARPRSACGGCAQAGGCGVSVVSGLLSRRAARLCVPDDCGARVGETVVLGIHRSSLLKASFVAYLLPIAGLVGGAILALALGGGDLSAMGAGFFGLATGLFAAHVLGRNRTLEPVVVGRGGTPTSGANCGHS